jgi:hypothetical protein
MYCLKNKSCIYNLYTMRFALLIYNIQYLITESAPEKEGRSKELISAELSVNKHWKGRKAESGQVISHPQSRAGSRSQSSPPESVSSSQSKTALHN